MCKKFLFSVSVLFFFIILNGDIYKVSIPDSLSADNKTELLEAFDIVSVYKNSGNTVYIMNLSSSEALQLKLLYNIEPFEFKLKEDPANYSDLDEINNRIEKIAEEHPEIAKIFTIGSSVEAREIKALRITGSNENDAPEILFTGLHHAREWISYEVPLSIAEFIAANYQSNKYIQAVTDDSILWFVPMLNPDGYVYSRETDRMWRYNRRVHPDSSIGVDLNRNYDSSWIKIDYIHGEEPFSEPETRAIRDLIENNVPSIPSDSGIQSLDGLVTYHSFGQLILYPPGSTNEAPDEVELYQEIGSEMSGSIFSQCGSNYLVMQITGLYNTYGEMTEWFMINNDNKPAFTFELRPQMGSSEGFDLSADQINDTVKENIPPAFYFINAIIKGSTEIDMDQDRNGRSDFIQNTEYEYECSRDDTVTDDSDHEIQDDSNDEGQTDIDTEVVEDNETQNTDESEEVTDESSDDNERKSSGCSLTKLI